MAHILNAVKPRASTSSIPDFTTPSVHFQQPEDKPRSQTTDDMTMETERRCAKSVWENTDSEDEEDAPAQLGMIKNHYSSIIDGAEKFDSFESLLQVDKIHTSNFYRSCLNVRGTNFAEFSIPWPTLKAKAYNIFKGKKNVFFTLDGMFIHWTPLITHLTTDVTISIIDGRGYKIKPTPVCSVMFKSHEINFTGMGLGTCVHMNDLGRIKLAVALKKQIAATGVKFASVDVCFYISISNKAGLQTHSVISPITVAPSMKNLLKDFSKVAEHLRSSNAKVIKKKRENEMLEEMKTEAGVLQGSVGPSLIAEQLKKHHRANSMRGVVIHEPLND